MTRRHPAGSPAAALIGLLLVVIGLGASVGAIAIERHERRIREGAVHTTGTVVNLLKRQNGRMAGSSLAPVIRFETAAGEHVDFTAPVSGIRSPYKAGDSVPIFYHPDNPSFADVDDMMSRWAGTALAGGVSLVFLITGAYFLRTSPGSMPPPAG